MLKPRGARGERPPNDAARPFARSQDGSVVYFDGRVLACFPRGFPGDDAARRLRVSSTFPSLRASDAPPDADDFAVEVETDAGVHTSIRGGNDCPSVQSSVPDGSKSPDMWKKILACAGNSVHRLRVDIGAQSVASDPLKTSAVYFVGVPPEFGRRPRDRGNLIAARAFRADPPGFLRIGRRYPPDEPAAARIARHALNGAVADAADRVARQYHLDVRLRTYLLFTSFFDYTTRMHTFKTIIYRRFQGATADIPNRVQDVAPCPSAQDYAADAEAAVRTIVGRALHRHVNDTVFRAFPLLSTSADNDNVAQGGFAKRAMGASFLHQSQRAYWSVDVLLWAAETAAPLAADAVDWWTRRWREN